MALSPIRANLLSIEDTPAKAVVSYEINSWAQTHQKRSAPRIRRPKRLQCSGQSLNRQPGLKQYSNLAGLRYRKDHLLASNQKPQGTQKALTTRPSTQIQNTTSSSRENHQQSQARSIKQFSLKLTEIKVSEFKEEGNSSHNLICFRNRKQVPAFLTKSINNGTRKPAKQAFSQYLQAIEGKILSSKRVDQIRRRGSNLLQRAPEAGSLVFKTRRILSVRQVEPVV